MEILKAVALLLTAFAAVFGIAYWKDKRAAAKKDKSKNSCCS